MNILVESDRSAYRRHRRGMFLFLAAAAMYLPGVLLALLFAEAVIGRQATGLYAGSFFFDGFLALGLVWLYGCRDALFYRCPHCGRRLRRCATEESEETNIKYLCGDCRTVWDLGWRFARDGGVGG